jgi:hypothetical protein
MVCTFGDELLLIGSEGSGDGIEQGGDGGIAALGQFIVLDRAEAGLDGVEVRAIGWQEGAGDAARPQVRESSARLRAAMDGAVVEHDDGVHRRAALAELLEYLCTVAGLYPRWAAIRGGLQPAADKQTISTRSRSAGVKPASRRGARTAAWSSAVRVRRIIHKSLPHPGPAA